MVPVQHAIGDSKSEWTVSTVFQRLWVRLLEGYDDLRGIGWKWQALDTVPVKAPLGGYDRSKSNR